MLTAQGLTLGAAGAVHLQEPYAADTSMQTAQRCLCGCVNHSSMTRARLHAYRLKSAVDQMTEAHLSCGSAGKDHRAVILVDAQGIVQMVNQVQWRGLQVVRAVGVVCTVPF